MINNCTTACC